MPAGEALRKLFVPAIDRTAPLGGPIAEAGGVLRLSPLSDERVQFYLAKLGPRERYRMSRPEIHGLLSDLSSQNIGALLGGYLGRYWSADYGLIWRAPPQSSSAEWHHDNVGNRLKIFIVLENESEQNGTEFIPFTHRTHWTRFSGRVGAEASALPARFEPQHPGDVLLFDTNVIHRGVYSPKGRTILQVEFTHILKSFLVPGQCGRYFRSRHERPR